MNEHNKEDLWDFSSYIASSENEEPASESHNKSNSEPEPVVETPEVTEPEPKPVVEAPEVTEPEPEPVVEAPKVTKPEPKPVAEEPKATEPVAAANNNEASKSETDVSTEVSKDALPTDNVDDYVYAHYHKHRKGKHGHHSHHKALVQKYRENEENKGTTVVVSDTSTHFRDNKKSKSKKRKWKKRPWWQKLLIILGWVLGIILLLLLILVVTLLILHSVGMSKLTDYSDMSMTAPIIDSSNVSLNNNGREVTYNGEKYIFNDDITSILCIGVDKDELGIDNETVGTGGQGDAIFLLALDTKTGETAIIGVPRDIVTDIGIYSSSGEYLRTEKLQLCLAYAYGDGRVTSCENTVTAVSRLFYQLPINSYFAIDISAISTLNDAIGGVTVTMIDNSFYDTNLVHHYKGETLTLYGDNARKYVQQRDITTLESSTDRLSRQINYLNAFTSKALSKTKKDLSTPVNLFNIVSSNCETNLDASTITAFASCLITNGITELDFISVPGHLESDGTYAEYVIDEEALYEMILDIYYKPAK